MSLVYAGVLSHAPGITGRADLVENIEKRDEFYAYSIHSASKSKTPVRRR